MFCSWMLCGTSRIPRILPWSGRSNRWRNWRPGARSSRTFATIWDAPARRSVCRRMSGWRTTAWKLKWAKKLNERPRMIYRSLTQTPDDFGPCAITIGNFDGVHRGHRQILRRVAALAREESWKSAVLTFDPHPAKLVTPASAPRLLTAIDERARMILEQGIDEILIL